MKDGLSGDHTKFLANEILIYLQNKRGDAMKIIEKNNGHRNRS